MPTFNANHYSFTPVTTIGGAPNWSLDSGVSTAGKIIQIGWGGSVTTSTQYGTRWARPAASSAGTGAKTAIVVTAASPYFQTASCTVTASYATTNPTLAALGASDLWDQSWNAQGGVGVIVFPLANPWWVMGAATVGTAGEIVCQNWVGTDALGSSYSLTWEEV